MVQYLRGGPKPEENTRDFFKQLCTGLQDLHRIGIAHRDIKMENLMIVENGTKVKYIDFGLSKVLLKGEMSTDRYGTMAFCSPEILSGRPHTI